MILTRPLSFLFLRQFRLSVPFGGLEQSNNVFFEKGECPID
jgi:hypothetical protein